jgi:hypothetical protein
MLEVTTTNADQEAAWRDEKRRRERPSHDNVRFKQRHMQEIANKKLLGPPLDGHTLLEHPIPLKDLPVKRRTVPHHLTIGRGGIPILLYKGRPAPVWFRNRINRDWRFYEKKFEQGKVLDALTELCEWEDIWEQILQRQLTMELSSQSPRRSKSHSYTNASTLRELGADKLSTYQSPAWAAYDQSTSEYQEHARRRGIRGWQLWQIRERERKMWEWENIPSHIASAIRNGQRLQDRIQAWAARNNIPCSSVATIRPKPESKALIHACLAFQPLHIDPARSREWINPPMPGYLKKTHLLRKTRPWSFEARIQGRDGGEYLLLRQHPGASRMQVKAALERAAIRRDIKDALHKRKIAMRQARTEGRPAPRALSPSLLSRLKLKGGATARMQYDASARIKDGAMRIVTRQRGRRTTLAEAIDPATPASGRWASPAVKAAAARAATKDRTLRRIRARGKSVNVGQKKKSDFAD